jgi:iron(III) transport system ATP-binding protein
MRVRFDQVSKTLGNNKVLDRISLTVEDHELFFLLGPSGCGKTTLLRVVAGFYDPDEGALYFGDRNLNGVAPHLRNAGMVFQNYALWPHMTVAENVAYGLDVRHLSRAEIKTRVSRVLSLVQMADFADRPPNQLSGGQQQRIALARALVIEPDVLLLDEPLSNLDAKLRLEMRTEIRRIHEQTRITTLYVTHDQKESLSLADRVAVMHRGRVEQVGNPRELYRQPATRFVADFVGAINWLPGQVLDLDAANARLALGFAEWRAAATRGLRPGQKVWVGFRPETMVFTPGTVNPFEAKITFLSYLGEIEEYELQVADGLTVRALELNPAGQRAQGSVVRGQVAPSDLLVFPREEGEGGQ